MVADAAQQLLRVVNINGIRCHVKITQPNNRHVRCKIIFKKRSETVKPGDLILKLIRIRVASLGHVGVNDFDPADVHSDKPWLFLGITVTKAGGDLPGLMSAYNGNSVIAFLAFKIAIGYPNLEFLMATVKQLIKVSSNWVPVPEAKPQYMGFSGLSPDLKMRIYSGVVLITYF